MRFSLRTRVAVLRPRVALAAVFAAVVIGLACDTQRIIESVERAIAAIRLTPGAALLRVGTRVPLSATPVDALGVAVPNATITWAVADTTVARVTPTGELWGRAPGHTTVRAAALSGTTEISATAPVDVTLVPVATVAVTPAPATLLAGSMLQMVAVAADSAGQPLAGRAATWASNNGTAATVSQAGVVTAVAAGQATITAVVEGRTGSSLVTVTALPPPPPPPPPVVTQIVLTPGSVTLAVGATQQFTATAQMSNGTQQPAAVTYSATGGTISGGGLYTAGGNGGSYRVIATQQGGTLADTSAVTITAPPPPPPVVVTRMDVTPATTTVAAGATRQFAATEFLSDGSSRAATGVTWTATGGTITAAALYTAGSSSGSYRVIGTKGTFADTAAVTVTAPPPPPPVVTQIIVTPASVTLATAAVQQFTATAQMSNGTQQPATVTWTATGGTVTAAGLYTAGTSAGSYRVIATQQGGTLADTAAITLNAPPPPPPPPPGGALAWFDDFRTSLTSKGLTWWIASPAVVNRLPKSSATGSWPTELTHVAENVYAATHGAGYQAQNLWPAPAVGQYLFVRMLLNNALPNGANTGTDHGFQTNVGLIHWFWRVWGGNATSFTLEFATWETINVNWLEINVPKNTVLRLEWRAERTTTASATLAARVYNNQTGALLGQITGLVQAATSTTFREFLFGMSGQGGATYNGGSVYWGALAARVSDNANDWIGPYPVAGVER